MNLSAETFRLIAGLPGEELIAPALRNLEAGEPLSIPALLLGIAQTRLREAGLPIPDSLPAPLPSFESRLYRALVAEDAETAYSRYNSLKRRLDSFIRALEQRQPFEKRTDPA